jgi:hypothetical protein
MSDDDPVKYRIGGSRVRNFPYADVTGAGDMNPDGYDIVLPSSGSTASGSQNLPPVSAREKSQFAGAALSAAGAATFFTSLATSDHEDGSVQNSSVSIDEVDNNLLLAMLAFSALAALSLVYLLLSSVAKKEEKGADRNRRLQM